MTDTSIKVACTIVPVQGYNLLLPNSCIAEVLIRLKLDDNENTNSWYIGETNWQEEMVPIISFEKIDSPVTAIPGKKSIIVVVSYPLDESKVLHFGILANQVPQVIQADNQTLDKQLTPNNTHSHAMSYVHIKGKPAIIPDISRIAKTLSNSVNTG